MRVLHNAFVSGAKNTDRLHSPRPLQPYAHFPAHAAPIGHAPTVRAGVPTGANAQLYPPVAAQSQRGGAGAQACEAELSLRSASRSTMPGMPSEGRNLLSAGSRGAPAV